MPKDFSMYRISFAIDAVCAALKSRYSIEEPANPNCLVRMQSSLEFAGEMMGGDICDFKLLRSFTQPEAIPTDLANIYSTLGDYHGWTCVGIAVYDLDGFPNGF